MAEPKTIKVCLTNQGADQETPWAEDQGPVAGQPGDRKVRLVNVPFMHAKPTWGDVVVVSHVKDGLPTWDREGVAFSKIGTRIYEDGGRWAMIVDYHPLANDTGGKHAFDAIAHACAEIDVVCEGAWAPAGNDPGRAYLAVSTQMTDAAVMDQLRGADVPCELVQVHPKPPESKKTKKTTKPKGTRLRVKPAKSTKSTKPSTKARAKRKKSGA